MERGDLRANHHISSDPQVYCDITDLSLEIVEGNTTEHRQFRMVPSSARSRAACGAEHLEEGNLSTENEKAATPAPSSCTENEIESPKGSNTVTVRNQRSGKSTNARGQRSPRRETLPTPCHIEADILKYLPPHDTSIAAMASTLGDRLSSLKFFGESFVKRFLMVDHEDYSIMLSGCILLSHANDMALTGSGTKATLLEIKGQVITRINARIESASGLLSPQCLLAILALGSPIVCLVSQDLPHALSMWDYINVSQYADYLCCASSAETAQTALHERRVHAQAMYNLFSKISGPLYDQASIPLLLYLSNSMDLTMALEAAHYLDTPLIEVGIQFPNTFPCVDCSLPVEWTSPLTCQWSAENPTTTIEKQMILLAGLMHKWLGTFLDGDCNAPVATKDLLEERSRLREVIEAFDPVSKTSCCEIEAMYECCRWASLVLLKVEKLSTPVYMAARYVRIQPRLTRRLRMTDLSNLWGNHRGLLFWVAAVCDFATAGQCFPLLCTTLLARMAQEIAMLDYCPEVGIKALKRLKFFESMCCDPGPTAHKSQDLDFRSYLTAYCEKNLSETK